MTEQEAAFIEHFDAERLAVGKAYVIDLLGMKVAESKGDKPTFKAKYCEAEEMLDNQIK